MIATMILLGWTVRRALSGRLIFNEQHGVRAWSRQQGSYWECISAPNVQVAAMKDFVELSWHDLSDGEVGEAYDKVMAWHARQ